MDHIALVREIFSHRDSPPLCCVQSYGCQQNVADGERITGLLCEMGCGIAPDIADADIIILNTCAVRENAERKVYSFIGDLKHIKQEHPDRVIGVCGCMAQESGTVEKIRKSYRHVDMIFGTFATEQLPKLLYDVLTTRKTAVDVEERKNECPENIPVVRSCSYKAGVSIMYGCNNFCSFCIVPYVRGRERSRRPENILDEIRGLADSGCREIMLLGQNVNSYGRGLEEKINFPELLRRINDIEGDFRIRFMSPHPKDATEEFFDVIASCDKICKSVHLPLQSGSNEILRKMHRSYTVEKYMSQVEYARKIMPGLSITTDIIVGFPNETREDFEATLDVMRKVKYDNIYSFIYSPRTGTKAALMEDGITDREKSDRMGELLALQRQISEDNYRRFEGRVFTVLFDSVYKNGMISGKSDEFVITLVQGEPSLIGTVHKVEVTRAHNWAVEGRIID
ncbi:MAG: tRNA (N6-isopentenyl adenosine(37)-C2)-methylthiotransferase MiaB [Oscillospiraceae bacterium]|nr:tRNA (N6-isopentenyl adenosine(37)-C2)-methylthiotransferase MiaB [Oscillospiraceae bacterium]